ncbi:PilN domain-containing protein [Pseudomonas sp. dw_358]|uniref:PilN domain-containing protein n=1 Tax=Pseudomonas sp. dw_358 TaxID=2720083 RepID=UPI001BD650C6|nr:PilN domain-containing protein [Pseudomonas sp. dw_358]
MVADNEEVVHWRDAALWDNSGTQIDLANARLSGSTARLVLVLAAENVLTRPVVLPPTAASELSAIMKYEVDRYMPFTGEQVYLDYERPIVRPDKSLQVNLVVVARRRLDGILQTLGNRGIKVSSVSALDRDGHQLQVDLTPNDWQVARADPHRRTGWILITVSVALTLLVMHLWVVDREDQLEIMRGEVRALRSQAQAVQSLRQSLSAARDEGQYVGVRKANASSMSGLLSELSQCIPSNTWLEQLIINPAGDVSLDGQSELASGLIDQMKKCTSLSNMGFSGVIQTDAATGKDRFSILAHLKREGLQNAPETKAP